MTMAEVCEDLNKRGVCRGDCCGVIPIDSKVLYRNRHLWQVEPIRQIPTKIGIFVETEDMHCIFLSRKKRLCMIYKDRPEVCRKYGTIKEHQCPIIKINGSRRTEEEQKVIEAVIDNDICNLKDNLGAILNKIK